MEDYFSPKPDSPREPWQDLVLGTTPPPKKIQSRARRISKIVLKPFILLVILFSKLKGILLLVAKAKLFIPFVSIFISIGAYALIWGWIFAVGFVALLFVHEMGHWVLLKHQGVKTSPIVFIPFLGAAIGMREMPKDAYREAQMALGGPILGSLGALTCLIGAYLTSSDMLQALAFVGFFLNLFNLIPVLPLDGGRVMSAVHPAFWFLGGVALIGVSILLNAWVILILVALIGVPELTHRWHDRHSVYYSIPTKRRLIIGLVYFSLAAVLVLGMFGTYTKRNINDHNKRGHQVALISPSRS